MLSNSTLLSMITIERDLVETQQKSLESIYKALIKMACDLNHKQIWLQLAGLIPSNHPFHSFILDYPKSHTDDSVVDEIVLQETQALFESASETKKELSESLDKYNQMVLLAIGIAIESPGEKIATALIKTIGNNQKYYGMVAILANSEEELAMHEAK